MRSKDLIRFFIVAALFVGALLWWNSQQVGPPRKEEKKLTADQQEAVAVLGQLQLNPLDAIAVGAGRLAIAEGNKKKDDTKPETETRWHIDLFRYLAIEEAGAKVLEAASRQPLVYLGSDKPDSPFHIGVSLDPRGACVAKLVLNKFQAANALGRGEDEIFTLLPGTDYSATNRQRSFQLYHYAIEDKSKERPYAYLGDVAVWQGGKPQEDEEGEFVSFWTEINGVKITKTFRLDKGAYHLALDVTLKKSEKAKGKDLSFRYQLAGGRGLPLEGQWYTASHRHSLIAQVEKGSIYRNYQELGEISLWLGGDEVTVDDDKQFQYAGVAVQYFASVIAVPDGDYVVAARPTLEARVVKEQLEAPVIEKKIIIHDTKDRTKGAREYFLTEEVFKELNTDRYRKGSRVGLVCVQNDKDQLWVVQVLSEAESHPLLYDDITVRVKTKLINLSDDEPVVHHYVLYNGPIKPKLLGQMTGIKAVRDDYVDLYLDTLHLNTLTDYHSRGWFGSFSNAIYWTNLLIFFTNVMHSILNLLHFLVPNYGICIILLTVLVRAMMLPVSRKQSRTMLKMQELAPEIKKLKEKFKDDRQGMAMAQMALFRKHGVNPLGSCWLLLLQMPVFMGLYYCLQESVHFRLAGFLWIDNLAAPDMLFYWGQGFPMLTARESMGGFLYLGPFFNLLPIVAITCMILQQKMMMPPPADDQQAAQQKMMRIMMIVFGILFYKVAAGLCLYFIVSTAWGFAERKLLPKKKPTYDAPNVDSAAERFLSTPAPTSTAIKAEPPRPAPGNGESNRNKRRQERKKRQQEQARKQAESPTSATAGDNAVTPKPKDDEGDGMFARLKRWWRSVVKKASKK